jgi:light-regulated signal transduction histidine kinase (bacteriophytochrome)
MSQTIMNTSFQTIRGSKEIQLFSYVASYDLQEHLRMVSSYRQLLSRQCKIELDEDANEFIQYALDSAQDAGPDPRSPGIYQYRGARRSKRVLNGGLP